jgi:hypothetical protein
VGSSIKQLLIRTVVKIQTNFEIITFLSIETAQIA